MAFLVVSRNLRKYFLSSAATSAAVYILYVSCVTFTSETHIPAIQHHAGRMTSCANSPSGPSLSSLSIYLFPSIQMETNYSSKKQTSCSRKWTAFIVSFKKKTTKKQTKKKPQPRRTMLMLYTRAQGRAADISHLGRRLLGLQITPRDSEAVKMFWKMRCKNPG